MGKRTDTLDITGSILEEKTVDVTERELYDCVNSFTGNIKQLPPMYSAIKQNGKKLYELAREGIEVERKARDIAIYSIAVTNISMPFVTIDVHCSKGTYIRSLCDDIGTRLGCGAVMTELRRTEAAGFSVSDAYTIDMLDDMNDISRAVIPVDRLFSDLPKIRLNPNQERSIRNGVRMTWRGGTEKQRYRLYGADDTFLCVSEICDTRLVLIKSFWS